MDQEFQSKAPQKSIRLKQSQSVLSGYFFTVTSKLIGNGINVIKIAKI